MSYTENNDLPNEEVIRAFYNASKKMLHNEHDRWISVKDRLPNEVGRYLVLRKQKTSKYMENIKIEWFHAFNIYSKNKDDHRLRFMQCGVKEDLRVTHWQPLPQPPKT